MEKSILEKTQADLKEQLTQARAEAKSQAKKDFQLELSEKDKDLSAITGHNKQLSEDYTNLKEELRQAHKQNFSQKSILTDEYDQKLALEKESLRQEVLDQTRLKDLEKDKKLADATSKIRQLEAEVVKTKAGLEQNLNQLQGEVLELDMEEKLKRAFPFDEIKEVKKFQKGADIMQLVKNSVGQECGLILWEAKNALWKKEWLEKLKRDMGEARANIAVLVSQQMPADQSDMHASDSNLWVVKPKLALALASALRNTLIEVHKTSQNSNLKDAQMKHLYDYIVSPEFKYKVESMLETYGKWRKEIDTEKKWFARKWGRQEKMLDQLTINTISVHSDFQGITNDALLELKETQLAEDNVDLDKEELDVF